jgi:hypothetical protein
MLFVFGGIALAAAPILLAVMASKKRKIYQMQSVQTSTAAQLEETRSQMKGSFIQRAELKGKSECDSPLVSEFTGTPCVAYSIRLERQYEETRWETDSKGNRSQRTQRGSEVLSTNERRAPFHLRDSTGRIKVVPDGAELHMEKSLSKFENSFPEGRVTIGSFALNLAQAALGAGRHTIGFKYEEKLIPLGRDLYVLGEASDESGELSIRRSSSKGEKFIISLESEEQLVASAGKAAAGLLAGAIASGAIGVTLLILGFFIK